MMIPAWVDGTLQPVEKLAVHQRGLRHPAVSVFVMNGPRTLIQRRALGKYHTPGLWANTCCTHPDWQEAPAQCAARRLNEELGIAGLTLRLADTVEYRAEVGGGLTEHEVVDIFIAEAPADLSISLNPEEVMDSRWVSLSALATQVEAQPETYSPWLRIYLANHASSIFGPDYMLSR